MLRPHPLLPANTWQPRARGLLTPGRASHPPVTRRGTGLSGSWSSRLPRAGGQRQALPYPLLQKGGPRAPHTVSPHNQPGGPASKTAARNQEPTNSHPPGKKNAWSCTVRPKRRQNSARRFPVASSPRPGTAHAPGFRPPPLPIPSSCQPSISSTAGSRQPGAHSSRPPICLAFFTSPGLSGVPAPPPHSHQALLGLGPTPPPALTEKIVLGPQGAHVHVHRIFHGVVART